MKRHNEFQRKEAKNGGGRKEGGRDEEKREKE